MGVQTQAQQNPTILIKEITDQYIRKNFQNMSDYFSAQNQFLNFKFFEIMVSGAQTSQTLAHGLGTTPKDIMVSFVSGPGQITFDIDDSDDKNLSYSTSDSVYCRIYVGSYWGNQSTNGSPGSMTVGGTPQIYTLPSGLILPFGGTIAPKNFLMCNGAAVSRKTYANLFAAIATAFGYGDGSTTFNLPNTMGMFLRGVAPIPSGTSGLTSIVGSGSPSSNNATFVSHGLTSGQKVRVVGGGMGGLTVGTDYYVGVVDANTLFFATSINNVFVNINSAITGGLSPIKITLSGTNSAVLQAWVDADCTTRTAPTLGANSGPNVGSKQSHALQKFPGIQSGGTTAVFQGAFTSFITFSGAGENGQPCYQMLLDASAVANTSSETRPINLNVNYIISI